MGISVIAAAFVEGASAATIMSAVAMVGTYMTVAGVVTGDKNLMQTGSMVALVGVAGGAAAGSGMFGAEAATGTAAAGGTQAAASAAADEAVASGGAGVEAASAAPAATAANVATSATPVDAAAAGPTGAINTPADVTAATTPGTVMPDAGAATPVSATPLPDGSSTSLTTTQGTNLAPSSPWSPADASTANANGASDFMGSYPGVTDSNTFFSGIGNVWNGMGDQGKAAVIQLAGGAMNGANQTAMWNEKMANQNLQTSLVSHGSEVANYKASTKVPGIINSAKG